MHGLSDEITIIRPQHPWFQLNLGELWRYRDLVLLFVRRDFVAQYKQTILGPIWFFLQPLFTTVVFTVVFGKIAKIPTDGIPSFLFYLSGTVCWSYFSVCALETSNTFIANAGVFGKVYFPRLVVPVAIVISNSFKFLIQFTLFLAFLAYFMTMGLSIDFQVRVLAAPLLVMQMGLLALGCGMLISSLTTKYRDLTLVIAFGMQLWMYATPVVYPLSQIPAGYRLVYCLNPMVAIVEIFRSGFFGTSPVGPHELMMSVAMTFILLFVGLTLFCRVEKTFMDTI